LALDHRERGISIFARCPAPLWRKLPVHLSTENSLGIPPARLRRIMPVLSQRLPHRLVVGFESNSQRPAPTRAERVGRRVHQSRAAPAVDPRPFRARAPAGIGADGSSVDQPTTSNNVYSASSHAVCSTLRRKYVLTACAPALPSTAGRNSPVTSAPTQPPHRFSPALDRWWRPLSRPGSDTRGCSPARSAVAKLPASRCSRRRTSASRKVHSS